MKNLVVYSTFLGARRRDKNQDVAEYVERAVGGLAKVLGNTLSNAFAPGKITTDDAENVRSIIMSGAEAGVDELNIEIDRQTALGLNLVGKAGHDLRHELGLSGQAGAGASKVGGSVSGKRGRARNESVELTFGSSGSTNYVLRVKYK